MNIDDLTIGQAKELARIFTQNKTENPAIDNGMIGKYVIVRCRDAGVHAGVLQQYSGRECLLTESKRLWYWKNKKGAFLSGIATYGLHEDSKVGAEVTVYLTEDCEILLCTTQAEQSIRDKVPHNE